MMHAADGSGSTMVRYATGGWSRLRRRAVLAVLALVAAACGGGGGEQAAGGACDGTVEGPVTIQVWFHSGQGAERETLEQQVEAFNDSQEDIQAELTLLPEGNYNEQVQAAAAAGDLPDVLDFDGPFLYNYAWAGNLQPMGSCFDAEFEGKLLPSIVEQATYSDAFYGIGTFDSGLGLFTRQSILEDNDIRIPDGWDDAWTAEEFTEIAGTLRDAGYDKPLDLKINYGQTEWYTYGFSPIVQSAGGDLINRDDFQSADGVLNSDASVQALEVFQSWFTDDLVDFNEDDAAFTDGRSAISWAVHNSYPPYSEVFDDLIIVPLPDFGQGARTGQGSWQWGIPTAAQDADASWAFIDFLMQDEEVVRMSDANGAPPATQSAVEASETYTADSPLQLFVDALEGEASVARPQTPAYPTITSAFQTAIGTVIDGGDVRSALDEAVSTIDSDIEQNEGYPPPDQQ